MPAKADLFISSFRKWVDKYGGERPPLVALLLTACHNYHYNCCCCCYYFLGDRGHVGYMLPDGGGPICMSVGGGPFGDASARLDPLSWRTPEDLLNRYDQHVRHCHSCSQALNRIRRLKPLVASITIGTIALTTLDECKTTSTMMMITPHSRLASEEPWESHVVHW